jgi:S-adenosylmethionine synthetase
MKRDYLFTSESVTEGHPDKLCDQIADAIVDRYLRDDPRARVIAECAVATGILFVSNRCASRATVDVADLARQVITRAGYVREDFNAATCSIMVSQAELSRDPLESDEAILDGDGLDAFTAHNMANVFGFACRQTPALLPLPIWLAHKLTRRLSAVRTERRLPYLAPDGKSQVGVEFHAGRPFRIHSVTLVASQVTDVSVSARQLRDDLIECVVAPVFADEPVTLDARTQVYVNPEGPVLVGGPTLHSGLTGRKNAIDTYGEYARHSESALSGKDPSRIDRVGAYAARHAAKNIVAAGLAEECEVVLSYSMGQARPVSIQIDTRGTGSLPDEEIAARVAQVFDFRPAAIVRDLGLRRLPAVAPQGLFYQRLGAYGHVGRVDFDLPWERLDRIDALR